MFLFLSRLDMHTHFNSVLESLVNSYFVNPSFITFCFNSQTILILDPLVVARAQIENKRRIKIILEN